MNYLIVKILQDGKMVRFCMEEDADNAYETCAELVRSGKTEYAVAHGMEFENRHDWIEIYGEANSVV